jgi:hypothetical protein
VRGTNQHGSIHDDLLKAPAFGSTVKSSPNEKTPLGRLMIHIPFE